MSPSSADQQPATRPEPGPATTRFRPVYRELSDLEQANLDAIKDLAAKLDGVIRNAYAEAASRAGYPAVFQAIKHEGRAAGREHALAVTKLEEAVMWAVKGLTA